jgi:hypothetical protein
MAIEPIIHGLRTALEGNEKTYATHPGRVKAQYFRVLLSYPFWPCLSLVAIIIGVAWLAVVGLQFWPTFMAGLGALKLFAVISEIRPHFREGDVCAGVVVCEAPLMVASFTDLTTDLTAGEGAYPAVKIHREPRRRFTDAAAKLGSPVASIARYEGYPAVWREALKLEHWTDFNPLPVQCATADEAEAARVMREISPSRWAELQAALRQLPEPFRPGLYRLWE